MENSFFKVLSTCPYITFTQCIDKTPLSTCVKGDVTNVWDHDHWISGKIQPLIGYLGQ